MAGPIVLVATYVLQGITPAPAGWRYVDWDGTRHIVDTVHVLGLATNSTPGDPPRLVSLAYTPQTDWFCCEERATFCGLLPPGWDLGRYEAQDPHSHRPTAAARYADTDESLEEK